MIKKTTLLFDKKINMKTIYSTLLILLTITQYIFSQGDTTSFYKNLETKKFYSVDLESSSMNSEKIIYKVNDKEVNESNYLKYKSTWENMTNCKPCILQYYDENNVLLREAVAYTDAQVGYFKEYYPNGQIRLNGFYKENTTENWDDLCRRNLCNVPVSTWTYYNEKGEILYTEQWDNGTFIQQRPEQNKLEIWKVEMTLNDELITNQTLTSTQVNELVITPKFKNSYREGINLTIDFKASTIGRKNIQLATTLEELKTIDIENKLIENGYKSNDKIMYDLFVYNNNNSIALFNPKIEVNLPIPNAEDSLIMKKYTTQTALPTYNYVGTKDEVSSKVYLVNSLDSSKKVQLYAHYRLNYFEQITDTLLEEKSISLYGSIDKTNSKDNSSIVFNFNSEDIHIRAKNGAKSYSKIDFYDIEWGTNNRLIQIEDIQSIYYLNSKRNFSNFMGGVLTSVSTMTALMIAPLISINFKNGDFDKEKYYKTAGSSLIGFAIGIPLIAIGQEKEYLITTKNGETGKNLWYIEIEN